MEIIIRVNEIKGHCPVHEAGDSFKLVDGYKLVSEKPVCMHSLAALMPFYNALRVSTPGELGLAGRKEPEKAYIQCPDAHSHTHGGTAVFEISRES